jgi:hypothetical protein
MTEFKNSSEFVKALLTQEPALNASVYGEHRRTSLDRLASAERRTRGRYILVGWRVSSCYSFALYALAIFDVVKTERGRIGEVFLDFIDPLPFTCALLTAIYFPPSPELRQTRTRCIVQRWICRVG